mgnify:CR=1 FL=1
MSRAFDVTYAQLYARVKSSQMTVEAVAEQRTMRAETTCQPSATQVLPKVVAVVTCQARRFRVDWSIANADRPTGG